MKPNIDTAAICGLFCATCPSYPLDCHGCLSDKLTAHCVSCSNGFRACAKEHNVVRCYECVDFPCERLQDFSKRHYEKGIGHHQNVIKDLQYMKNNGVQKWVDLKTLENTCPICGELIHWMDKNDHKCK
ncbi:MAG: DUF3795 domain-containing protein [Clostridia bacterium]